MLQARKVVPLILTTLLVAAGGVAYYYYHQYAELRKDPQKITQEEIARIIARVSKHLVLPEGEAPTVATVTNPERLKDQLFFAKAKPGDRVLIYTKAQKAVLYDPAMDRVIEVAPLNVGNPLPKPPPAPTPKK